MKKCDLKKLALMGLSSGLLIASQLHATAPALKTSLSQAPKEHKDNNDGNVGYHVMSEDELLLELNDDGIAQYKSLDAKGKELALKVASQRCNWTNQCAGLNACQTEKNDCAGKGKCQGQGKCAISDKNLAVKLVYDKMAKKRAGMMP